MTFGHSPRTKQRPRPVLHVRCARTGPGAWLSYWLRRKRLQFFSGAIDAAGPLRAPSIDNPRGDTRATIGTFTLTRDGFFGGTIRTLTLDTPVQVAFLHSEREGAPLIGSLVGETWIGAAWTQVAHEGGKAYH